MGKNSELALSYFQVVGEWPDFTVVVKLRNVLKSLYGFGGRCQEIRDNSEVAY